MNFDRSDYINQPVTIDYELKWLFNQNDSLTIFEIGACEGEESIKYARLFPNSSIYAFEPLPDNIKLIHDNFLQYGINNATYFNKALSSENGIAQFHVSSGRPENAKDSNWDYGNKSSSLLPPAKHLKLSEFIHFEKIIEVETITLQSFCSANNICGIDFIHMDVQGAELLVLEGAGDLIHSIKVIWLEVSKVDMYKNQPLVNDVKKFMEANNFVLIKDALKGVQGDQLYISNNFYKKRKAILLFMLISAKDFIRKWLVKLRLSK